MPCLKTAVGHAAYAAPIPTCLAMLMKERCRHESMQSSLVAEAIVKRSWRESNITFYQVQTAEGRSREEEAFWDAAVSGQVQPTSGRLLSKDGQRADLVTAGGDRPGVAFVRSLAL